jgi:hypothetical protein
VLARKREWSHDVLNFLPVYIDDLYARQALIHGGIALVDEFRYQLLKGRGVEHAREQLVPPAFAEAIDDAIALDLFAAAVALMARLSGDSPAGCLAEEIIAVALLEEANAQLGMGVEKGDISEEEAEHARGELRGLFDCSRTTTCSICSRCRSRPTQQWPDMTRSSGTSVSLTSASTPGFGRSAGSRSPAIGTRRKTGREHDVNGCLPCLARAWSPNACLAVKSSRTTATSTVPSDTLDLLHGNQGT